MADNSLFPVFDVPSETTEDTYRKKTAVYNYSPLWDFEKGDFVSNGAGQLLYGTGYEAWVFWCVKTMNTQRWAHLAYSDNAGIESKEAFGEPDRAAVQSAFERTITEALLADPMGRTLQVRSFVFSWENDSLRIECEAVGADRNTAALSTTFSA